MSKPAKEAMKIHYNDPYKNFLFRLKWEVEGEWRTVLGVSKMSGLKRTTEVLTHRSGGEDDREHKAPGRSSYDSVSMERGVSTDQEFIAWATQVQPHDQTERDLVTFKRNLQLEVLNEKMIPVIRYFLYDCWVSESTLLPELDADTNAVAIESIRFEVEGWERDIQKVKP